MDRMGFPFALKALRGCGSLGVWCDVSSRSFSGAQEKVYSGVRREALREESAGLSLFAHGRWVYFRDHIPTNLTSTGITGKKALLRFYFTVLRYILSHLFTDLSIVACRLNSRN